MHAINSVGVIVHSMDKYKAGLPSHLSILGCDNSNLHSKKDRINEYELHDYFDGYKIFIRHDQFLRSMFFHYHHFRQQQKLDDVQFPEFRLY